MKKIHSGKILTIFLSMVLTASCSRHSLPPQIPSGSEPSESSSAPAEKEKSDIPYDTVVTYETDMEPIDTEIDGVKATAEQALYAMQNLLPNQLVQYADFNVWYYALKGEKLSDEELSQELKNAILENEAFMWGASPEATYTAESAEPVSANDVMLREIYQSVVLSPQTYMEFPVTKIYKVVFNAAESGRNYKSTFYVMNINSEWKLDIAFITDKKYHDQLVEIEKSRQIQTTAQN